MPDSVRFPIVSSFIILTPSLLFFLFSFIHCLPAPSTLYPSLSRRFLLPPGVSISSLFFPLSPTTLYFHRLSRLLLTPSVYSFLFLLSLYLCPSLDTSASVPLRPALCSSPSRFFVARSEPEVVWAEGVVGGGSDSIIRY